MSDIVFEGLDDVIGKLETITDLKRYEEALKKACLVVERDAKKKAPKGIGDLRRSIKSKVEIYGGEVEGVVYTPLEYAPYVEYGTGLFAKDGGRTDVPWNYQDDEGNWHTTSGMKPQPYMRPALNENRETILRIVKEGMTDND